MIIPAYNEKLRLPAFLEHVLGFLHACAGTWEVIVVDDGSSDGTAQSAERPGVQVISHAANRGKGAAVRTGMAAARGVRRLFADADGATRMDELAALEAAVANGAEIAIGSREGGGKQVQVSATRRFLGRWFNRAVRMGSVRGIRDTQCGFKLFASARAIGLFELLQEDGYAFDVELVFLAQRLGVPLAEVPVNWTAQPGSKVRVWRDGMRMLRAVRRIRRRWRQGVYGARPS